MSSGVVRVLLVADTHLGFDMPFRPRIERRRRGPDFFSNFKRALQPALRGDVDLVVHGGDLFYRSKVPAALVEMALAPLVSVAAEGIPVYIVPGNHERSSIPAYLWSAHPNIHVFDRPRTFLCAVARGSVALSGFPFERRVRDVFGNLVRQTLFEDVEADVRLLCMHQAVEGGRVGVSDFTFRRGPDVVKGREIPEGFAAVPSGHIHRAQVLTCDLRDRPLGAPVIYPGSVERTSFAERNEDKAYTILTFSLSDPNRGRLVEASFIPLPARPMICLVLEPEKLGGEALADHLAGRLLALDPDSVVRVQLRGPCAAEARDLLSAAVLRRLAPRSMNISLARDRTQVRRHAGRKGQSRKHSM